MEPAVKVKGVFPRWTQLTRSHSYSEGSKVAIKNIEIVANPGGMKRKAADLEIHPANETLKRKVNPVVADLMDMLEFLQGAAKKLNDVVSAHINTKKEIKEVNNDLQRVSMFLNRSSVKSFFDASKWEKVETPTYDADTQTEGIQTNLAGTTVAVQTQWDDMKREQELLAQKNRDEIISKLSSAKELKGLESIIDRSWPEEAFRSTRVETESLDTVALEGDLVLIVNPSTVARSQQQEKLERRIPIIATLLAENLIEGQLEYITVRTEMVNRKGENKGQTRTVYALPQTMDETGMTDVETLFTNCSRLRTELKQPNTFKVVVTGKMDMDYLRKCLEYVFGDSEFKVTIVDHTRGKPGRTTSVVAEKARKRPPDYDKHTNWSSLTNGSVSWLASHFVTVADSICSSISEADNVKDNMDTVIPWFSRCWASLVVRRYSATVSAKEMSGEIPIGSKNTYHSGEQSVAYVTAPSEEVAKKIAHGLVSNKLAACVNIIPRITSIYEWENKINEDSEVLMMIKTRTSKMDQLTEFVKANHPYTVCEVISLPIQNGNEAYLKWMNEVVPSD
ncbi:unnamed protein product [Callosobruchus maculatus]|uniref:Uncharacterized protein n=1 Tax=Callosobruchus maculatus TaxID=64391 RepID=A0A653DB99_CALMS|nr:unnamed protein product [Callosobruchus maculatus]